MAGTRAGKEPWRWPEGPCRLPLSARLTEALDWLHKMVEVILFSSAGLSNTEDQDSSVSFLHVVTELMLFYAEVKMTVIDKLIYKFLSFLNISLIKVFPIGYHLGQDSVFPAGLNTPINLFFLPCSSIIY